MFFLNEIIFSNSEFKYLFILIPVWGICYLFLYQFKFTIFSQYFSHLKIISYNLKKSLRREFLSAVMLSLAFLFLVIAAMGPQYGKIQEEVKQTGIDIVVAIDVSKSMDAEDIKPSRLRRAKLELTEFINKLKGDRVGLITFAGKTVRNSPLTVDYFALNMFLNEINTDMIRYQGTDLRGAIFKSLESFSDKNAKGRALVLISDGENHQQSLEGAIEKAKEMNVKIYTIGAGSIEGAPIPIQGRGFKRKDNGEVIVSKLMPTMLQDLADKSGGKYFSSSNQGYQLDGVYKAINSDIDKVLISQKMNNNLINRYQIPLFISLFLIFLEYIFVRRGGIILSVLFFLILPNHGYSNWFQDSFSALYDSGKFAESEELIKKDAIKNQSVMELYNLGASFYQQGKMDEAIALFNQVKEDAQLENKVKGGFGLGNAFFKKAEFEKAINAYENVLAVKPNDEDTKKNLELAKKMMNKNQEENKDNSNQDQNKKSDQKQEEKKSENQKKDKQDSENNEKQNQEKKDSEQSDKQNQEKQHSDNNENSEQKKPDEMNNSSEKNDQKQENSDDKKQKHQASNSQDQSEDNKNENQSNEQNQLDQKEENGEKNQEKEKSSDEQNKQSFRSRMLLDQVEDSRQDYQKNMQNREPRFNNGGENDW